jgi:hypothetical protein
MKGLVSRICEVQMGRVSFGQFDEESGCDVTESGWRSIRASDGLSSSLRVEIAVGPPRQSGGQELDEGVVSAVSRKFRQ